MDMTGERLIPASRDTVWKALNDPEVLKAAIPGCTSLVKQSDTEMTAIAALKIGPIQAKFSGKVELLDLDPPNGYRIVGDGQGGIAGFAKGAARIRLSERDEGTLLGYTAEVQIGGKIAQLGSRLIDSTAKQMTNVFFDRFVEALAVDKPTLAAVAESNLSIPESNSSRSGPETKSAAFNTQAKMPSERDRHTVVPVSATPVAANEVMREDKIASSVHTSAVGQWHGKSLLVGVLMGAAIVLVGTIVGHFL